MMNLNENKFEEEEEDLELLRMAALKSLNNTVKKPVTTSKAVGNAIQVLENASIPHSNQTNLIDNMNYCVLNRLEPVIEQSEPYVPQKINIIDNWDHRVSYIQNVQKNSHIIPQLSPRSLAFVQKNNQILMKRKGEKSPRTASPTYHRDEPMRWSKSPSPHKLQSPTAYKRRLNSRSPSNRKRSISRSPQTRYTNSPPIRSPKPIKRSPNRPASVSVYRRSSSRSPKLVRSKSPCRRPNSPTVRPRRRSPSPVFTKSSIGKYFNGKRGRERSRSGTPSNSKNRKSHSPLPSNKSSFFHRRTRSPPQNSHNSKLTKRSRSRSPLNRKLHGERLTKNNNNKRSFRNNTKPDFGRKDRNMRYNYSTIRSNIKHVDRISDSSHSELHQIQEINKESRSKSPTKSPTTIITTAIVKKRTDDDNKSTVKKELTRSKTEEETVEELLVSTDDENSERNSSVNGDDDEIDLFASEESESENEGRFKSISTSKSNEFVKPKPTLSYTKLGSAAATEIGELKEINASISTSTSNRNKYDYRRGRRNGERDYSKDRKYEERSLRGSTRNDVWKTSRSKMNDRSSTNHHDKFNKTDTPATCKFRSTFQAVDEKDQTTNPFLFSADFEGEGSSTIAKSPMTTLTATSSAETIPSSLSSTKKPIHLRLGALGSGSSSSSTRVEKTFDQSDSMTKTTPSTRKLKKSWRIEKV